MHVCHATHKQIVHEKVLCTVLCLVFFCLYTRVYSNTAVHNDIEVHVDIIITALYACIYPLHLSLVYVYNQCTVTLTPHHWTCYLAIQPYFFLYVEPTFHAHVLTHERYVWLSSTILYKSRKNKTLQRSYIEVYQVNRARLRAPDPYSGFSSTNYFHMHRLYVVELCVIYLKIFPYPYARTTKCIFA